MAGFKLAEVTDTNGQKSDVMVSGGTVAAVATPLAVTVIVALIGAFQPVAKDIFTYRQSVTTERLKAETEGAKVEQERLKLGLDLLKTALTSPDATERARSVRFLTRAGVLKPELAEIKPEDVPRWPDKAAAPTPVETEPKKAAAKSSN